MDRDLSYAEQALIRADRSDAEEERVETFGALAAVAIILAIFTMPAMVSLMGGWKLAMTWVSVGLLGATPLFHVLRQRRERRLLARNPIPAPRPTTQMWLEACEPSGSHRDEGSTQPGVDPT